MITQKDVEESTKKYMDDIGLHIPKVQRAHTAGMLDAIELIRKRVDSLKLSDFPEGPELERIREALKKEIIAALEIKP